MKRFLFFSILTVMVCFSFDSLKAQTSFFEVDVRSGRSQQSDLILGHEMGGVDVDALIGTTVSTPSTGRLFLSSGIGKTAGLEYPADTSGFRFFGSVSGRLVTGWKWSSGFSYEDVGNQNIYGGRSRLGDIFITKVGLDLEHMQGLSPLIVPYFAISSARINDHQYGYGRRTVFYGTVGSRFILGDHCSVCPHHEPSEVRVFATRANQDLGSLIGASASYRIALGSLGDGDVAAIPYGMVTAPYGITTHRGKEREGAMWMAGIRISSSF